MGHGARGGTMRTFAGRAGGWLGCLTIGVLLAHPVLGANPPGPTPFDQGSTAMQADQASVQRDERYRDLLTTFERFKAVWEQQPGNVKALQQYLVALREHVAAVRQPQKEQEATTPRPSRTAPTGEASVQAPGGPAQPSREPSSEENVRKREEAMKKFLPAGPLEERPLASKTLVGVPEVWIDRQGALAEEELARIERTLHTAPPDREAMNSALGRLQTILYQLDKPPPSTLPVTPK
jgi:hypothetical protein